MVAVIVVIKAEAQAAEVALIAVVMRVDHLLTEDEAIAAAIVAIGEEIEASFVVIVESSEEIAAEAIVAEVEIEVVEVSHRCHLVLRQASTSEYILSICSHSDFDIEQISQL